MRAWYDILQFGGGPEDEAGIRASQKLLEELIAGREARHEAIVLAGFSQGGAIVLQTALRHPERLAGVLALSTYLPLACHAGEAERSAANRDLPIFMAHGAVRRHHPARGAPRQSRKLLERLGYRSSGTCTRCRTRSAPPEIERYPPSSCGAGDPGNDVKGKIARMATEPSRPGLQRRAHHRPGRAGAGLPRRARARRPARRAEGAQPRAAQRPGLPRALRARVQAGGEPRQRRTSRASTTRASAATTPTSRWSSCPRARSPARIREGLDDARRAAHRERRSRTRSTRSTRAASCTAT